MLLKSIRRWSVFVLAAIILVGLFTGAVLAGEEPSQFNLAKLNPDFIQYINEHPGGSATGYIPPTVDLSFLKGKNIFVRSNQLRSTTLPEKYDLRDHNKLTPVKNQNPYGTCWTFASLGSLESCLLPGETNDFSENNMALNHGFVWDVNEGGNNNMAMAYLTRWSGPVNQSDDPYDMTKRVGQSPVKHVQEIITIPARSSWDDNDDFKQAVMDYGAVATSLYWNNIYYHHTDSLHTYYYYVDGEDKAYANHAIDIVGWDDTYPATNFEPKASNNGAFLVRNSWGAGWGDNGYFWVSYEDTLLGRDSDNAVYCNAESIDNYDDIYQYDPLGFVGSVGIGSSTFAKGANVFTADKNEYLEAVGTYIMGVPGNTANVYIYTGVDSSPVSGTLKCDQTETIEAPGYHTIKLNSPVALTAGEKFSVVVEYNLAGSGNYSPLPCEIYSSEYAQSEANPGESYIFSNYSWRDATTIFTNNSEVNVCIKAYTSDTPPAPVTGVTLDKETMNLDLGGASGTLTAAVQPENANNKKLSWSTDHPNVAAVNNGVVTPVGEGTATITVITEDGGFTDTCEVTVNVIMATGVALDQEVMNLIVGGATGTLTATVQPNNASDKNLIWNSNHPEVASVSNGIVTPVGEGTATITVTTKDGGFQDTCEVTVDVVSVTGVTLDLESMNLNVGDPRYLTATVQPNDASSKNVTWESSKPSVATVNSNGLIIPVGVGETTITVTTVDGGFQDTCEITVNLAEGPDLAITLDEYPEEATAGSKISLKATVLSCGTVDAPKATVEIYIGDTLVCTKSVSKLKWGKSKTLSIKATVPANLPVGACDLTAVVAPVLPVQEIGENNNTDVEEISIVLPDLTINSIVPAGGLIAGKGVYVTVNICNQRNAEAKKFTVKLYLSEDGLTCGQLLGTKKISKLKMGSTELKIRAKTTKDFNLASYYIIAIIDEENVVNEENEYNNRIVWSNDI
ncbi:MAG: lectin like domain-containing protein [Chitinophagales bacterium]